MFLLLILFLDTYKSASKTLFKKATIKKKKKTKEITLSNNYPQKLSLITESYLNYMKKKIVYAVNHNSTLTYSLTYE